MQSSCGDECEDVVREREQEDSEGVLIGYGDIALKEALH